MDRLKRKRAARRTRNTKLINELEIALQSATIDVDSVNALRNRLLFSNEELRKVNEEIEPLVADDDLNEEFAAVADFEDEVARIVGEAQVKAAQHPPFESSRQRQDAGDRGDSSHGTGVKLPKLQLLHFQGELTQWQPFWEQFDAAVNQNTSLSEAEKCQHLRSLLVGPAANAISGLQATAACYKDAVEILTERFGDKRRIEREHLGKLRSLPNVKSERDVKGLRDVYDHVQTNIRGLRSLGVSSTTYATMMTDILLSGLPASLVVEYHRITSYWILLGVRIPAEEGAATADDGTNSDTLSAASTDAGEELTRLLRFLRVQIESRERTSLGGRPFTSPTALTSRPQQTGGLRSTLVFQSSSSVEAACFFCDGEDHQTNICSCGISLEERKKRLSRDNRCFRCTKRGHRSRDCRSKSRCSTCGGRHVVSMCNPAWEAQLPPRGAPAQGGESANVLTAGSMSRPGGGVLLQTFRGWVAMENKCAYIRGIIDGGSQKTFIREDLATRLQLDVIGQLDTKLNTFANPGTDTPRQKLNVVRLCLRGQYATTDHVLEAVVVPFICTDLIETPVEHLFVRTILGDLADELMFPSVKSEAGISLLIGADQMWRLLTGETRRAEDATGLMAIATLLGWTFQGSSGALNLLSSSTNTFVCVLRVGIGHEDDATALRNFWELDSIGIVDEPTTSGQEHDKVTEHFRNNITMKEGRYEVALPWKDSSAILDDNYGVATKRLHSLVRRLKRDGTVKEYDKAIRRYLEDGHAEKVREGTRSDRIVYYMPHRGVVRANSASTKLQVAFDASAHAPGSGSLNDYLEKGPKTNTELLRVLLQFRMHKVAVTADIQMAFLQISIADTDRDALRFLWFSHAPRLDEALPAIEEWRMTRVPFGSTASPFLLGATLRHHLESVSGQNEAIASILRRSFYVDDLLTGASNVDEAEQLASGAQEILRGAGMELCKWSTNSPDLQRILDRQAMKGETTSTTTPIGSPEITKVLGLVWDKTADAFRFSGEHLLDILSSNRNTKRSVLQASARIFDPLGFPAPYVIRVKMLFQRMWQQGLGWDEELPDELHEEWAAWCSELVDLRMVVSPRCLLRVDGDLTELQLHIFTDASPLAYGACAYLRAVNSTGDVSVTLIIAKARVAPLKTLSLPRLELMGAVMGERLAAFLRASVFDGDIEVSYWTDSMITLGWIKGTAVK